MKVMRIFLTVWALASLLLASCSKDQAEAPDAGTGPVNEVTAETVTYANFIGGLIQAKCSACHAAGGQGSASWTFSGYPSLKTNSAAIDNAVLVTGTMPLTGSLSANEKALLKAWFDKNMPEQ